MNTSKSLDQIAEDLFSAGQVQMAAIQTGKKLPKNYADNRIKEFKQAIVEAVEGLIIGKDEKFKLVKSKKEFGPPAYLKPSDMPKMYRNKLREQQRKAIKEWQ